MVHTRLSNASIFNPPGALNPNLAVFKELMIKDLQDFEIKNRPDTYARDSVRTLCENKNLIIRPADKVGGIVLLDKSDYQQEMNNLLSDRHTYQILRGDQTSM